MSIIPASLYEKDGTLKLSGLNVNRNLLIIGLIIKLICGSLFASSYLRSLFLPFIRHFIENGGNPYQTFLSGPPEAFPYPGLMLYAQSSFLWLFQWFWISDSGYGVIALLLARLPLLIADFVILVVLLRWLKDNSRMVLWLYWLNPVLFYITYLHGQLDVIPISLLFTALYFLFKSKYLVAALFTGMALATKTNIFVCIPFLLIYVYNREGLTKAALTLAVTAAIFLTINVPFLFSDGFYFMVFKNHEQVKVYSANYAFPGDLVFFFTPAAFLLLIARAMSFKMISKDVFLMFLGFGFGVLTLLIPPMQGWYYWILPFYLYFYLRKPDSPIYTFYALNFAYLVYFGLIPKSDFFNLSGSSQAGFSMLTFFSTTPESAIRITGLAFTLLQTVLLANTVWMYQIGIRSNIRLKMLSQPFLLGIGGDSGAGKSTVTELLQKVFVESNTAIVRGDDMHKWERGDLNWQRFTHLDPKANLLHNDLQHAIELKAGRRINRRHYDHATGRFTMPHKVNPNKLVVFEGLHPFFLDRMRNVYDLKIFINPEEQLRLHWKIKRDTAKRGYSVEKILEQIKQRETDSAKYIQTQSTHAELVVSYGCIAEIEQLGEPDFDPEIYLKIRLVNNIDIDPLVEELTLYESLTIEHQYLDESNQELKFRGDISAAVIDLVAYRLIPELDEITLAKSQWVDGFNGLIQLVITYNIFRKMHLENAKTD